VSLHPWAAQVVAVRAGAAPPVMPLLIPPRLTKNQAAGHAAQLLVCCEYAPEGHPLGDEASASRAAELLSEGIDRERAGGLFGGEGPASYALQHCAARGVATTALISLHARYPGAGAIEEALQRVAGWWAAVISGALELRGVTGIVRWPGDRQKGQMADEEGGNEALGLDVVADWADPLPAGQLHPDLRLRLRETPPDHPYFTTHRQTHGLLRAELAGPAGLFLRPLVPPDRPRAFGRLDHEVYVCYDPLGTLTPELPASLDTDGKDQEVDRVVRWNREARLYQVEVGAAKIPKGFTAEWEIREDLAGRLVRVVALHGVQGVRAGEMMPHPDGTRPTGGGWRLLMGPQTEPFPLPSLEAVHAALALNDDPPPPPPPPEFLPPSIITWPRVNRPGSKLHSVALLRAAAVLAERELARDPVGGTDNPELARLVTVYRDRFRPAVLHASVGPPLRRS